MAARTKARKRAIDILFEADQRGANLSDVLAERIVLSGRETRTLPVAVYNVLTFEQLSWGPLAAAAIIVTLPVLLLTIFIQKEIVAGLTHGGVKGG